MGTKLIMKKIKKTIGVLGGMGAAASANFYQKLVEIAQKDYGAIEDDDFPAIWIYNLPIQGFDETGFVDPEFVKSQLVESVKKLESIGSDFIVIPCNTVHHFIAEMRNAINIPIISIIETAVKFANDSGYKKVGLLNSESTKNLKLYETACIEHAIATLTATDSEQSEINNVILNVIGGKQGEKDAVALQKIVDRYKNDGAESVVLGCTELPLAFSQENCDLPVLNTITLLAKAALQHAYTK